MRKHIDSEEAINFYLDELCPRANEVLRIAYMLTLSREGSLTCVNKAYESLCAQLKSLLQVERLDGLLVKEAWDAFQKLGARPNPDASPMARKLSALSLDERAALAACDISGLTAPEAARALSWETSTLRAHLGRARKKICQSPFESSKDNAQGM